MQYPVTFHVLGGRANERTYWSENTCHQSPTAYQPCKMLKKDNAVVGLDYIVQFSKLSRYFDIFFCKEVSLKTGLPRIVSLEVLSDRRQERVFFQFI